MEQNGWTARKSKIRRLHCAAPNLVEAALADSFPGRREKRATLRGFM
jgi:hypothetical protein